FFFQAEDGIRDRTVTGVQTCALPISNHEPGPAQFEERMSPELAGEVRDERHYQGFQLPIRDVPGRHQEQLRWAAAEEMRIDEVKIGRASCRERVWISVVGE